MDDDDGGFVPFDALSQAHSQASISVDALSQGPDRDVDDDQTSDFGFDELSQDEADDLLLDEALDEVLGVEHNAELGEDGGGSDGEGSEGRALDFGVDDASSDDSDLGSVGGWSRVSFANNADGDGAAAAPVHADAAAPVHADAAAYNAGFDAGAAAQFDRMKAAQNQLKGNELTIALVIWSLTAEVSANNMERLFRILHAVLAVACAAAKLPKRYDTAVKRIARAEKAYRAGDAGFVGFEVPITEDVLVRKRLKAVTVIRRSIRETVSRICQNPKNSLGSLRTTCVATPGMYGDVMNSPMLLRIQDLCRHVWERAGVPVAERLTLYVVTSNDGTAITRGGTMPVEASTISLANLARDDRSSNGNVKLLSVFRAPRLHNPTVASQKKSKYAPTTAEKEALQ